MLGPFCWNMLFDIGYSHIVSGIGQELRSMCRNNQVQWMAPLFINSLQYTSEF